MRVQYVNASRMHRVVHYGAAMKSGSPILLLVTAVVVLLIVAVTQTAAAADNNLEGVLNQQYRNRIYTLRQPMTASTQEYDSLGNSATASAFGPWTIYGQVQIKKIKLETNRILVEGQRVGMKFNSHKHRLVPTQLHQHVTLQVSLDRPLDSPDQAHTILGHIFAFREEEFLASVPEFWRKYLAKHITTYAGDGNQIAFKPQEP